MVVHNLRNTAMQFCNVKITHSLFYNYLFHAQLLSVHADKRSVFLKWIYVLFYRLLRRNERTLTQLYADTFLADVSHVLVMFDMILDKGGGRHGHHVCVRSVVGSLLLSS